MKKIIILLVLLLIIPFLTAAELYSREAFGILPTAARDLERLLTGGRFARA